MLTSLYIENIAVIEKSNIDFHQGLNVLTGETGAGKSIVIDAINAIMGHRASKEIIRNDCDTATVFATFTDVNSSVIEKLENNGYSLEDDQLIISRTLSLSGKNLCRINGKPANVSILREVGLNLINIHGQHESYELFAPEMHIKYIDNLSNCSDLKAEYKNAFLNYKKLMHQLKKFESDYSQREQRIDILSYQVEEIENAQLQIGEYELLEEERRVLINSEKITSSLYKAKSYLEGNNSTGAIDLIDDAVINLQKASRYNTELDSLSEKVLNLYYELQEVNNDITDAIDNNEFNPYRLNEIEERLDLLNKLSRKYGTTTEEILEFCEKAKNELDLLLKYDDNHNALIEACNNAKNVAQNLADKLTEVRLKTAKEFEQKVKKEMAFLDMPRVDLVVSHETVELSDNGQDYVELLISANPGELPKPVAKIASGGELSRIMLAIKTVLASTDLIDTLIFDEVDTGVSGSASQKVGFKLKEVSQSRQVLCVTHQAQIAALADNHYLIQKQIKDERTYTNINLLDYQGRLNELARIIDGINITDTALAHAEKLMNYNGE